MREVNDEQKCLLLSDIPAYFSAQFADLTVAVWGLAFKPETDDVREAPGCMPVPDLLAAGAHVRVYDPIAMPNAQRLLAARLGPADLDRLTLAPHAGDALASAYVLALATEWKEFSSPDAATMARQLRAGAVFDGRNQYRPETVRGHGLGYWGVGRGSAA